MAGPPKFETDTGFPHPYGVTPTLNGYNFAVFSKHATLISLCIFLPDEDQPICEIQLDPQVNKTGNVWHIALKTVPPHYHYGYRVAGPYNPLQGHCFDNRMIVLDPYAKLVAGPQKWANGKRRDINHVHKGIIFPFEPFDWQNDIHPKIPFRELVIYEMHVRGFTQDPSSEIKNKGTFAAVIEKIPYLQSLGVNAVELMPIHEFNELENLRTNPLNQEPLFNYWGYSTINFFSPMNRYGTGENSVLSEFKQMVKALHANGIEVILDVVYNHTAEGNQSGPIISFKGLENSVYYMLAPDGSYYNFSGCGNTFNCNIPVVRELIKDSLRYWVTEMHVDGFRFDLASILVRSHDGIPLVNPPLIESITLDPILADTKLIAEAWDAGGLYQVGSFPGLGVWAEWNGKYRDDVRAFMKGTDGMIGSFATRLSGSEDLYGKNRLPSQSINFITAHDGFSLADLVSYNEKHNESNGEDNRDGDNNNQSWNCGVEGPTDDASILGLRERQRKNFHVALMVSQGVPMILMGDEYGHTKDGNNNTWGHDSRMNWFQWDTLEKSQPFFRFYSKMIAFRKAHPALYRSQFLGNNDIFWHGTEPDTVDWHPGNRFLACSIPDRINNYTLYIGFNAFYSEVQATLPPMPHPWLRCVYTFLESPNDILEMGNEETILSNQFIFAPYSSVILKCKSAL
jgi:isoamylase